MILRIEDDFDLGKIAGSGQCFRWRRADDGAYRVIAGDRCVYAARVGEGAFSFDCDPEAFDGFWRHYFDLEEDYRAIRARIDGEGDPFLWAAAEWGKGIRILRQDPWEMLVTSIITQNRNIPAIQRSVELLARMGGDARTDGRGEAYHAFPPPERVAALTEEQLIGCKLGYRWRYVRAAAEAVACGRICLEPLAEAPCAEAVGALTALYGVGEKVASCVALFGLHQLDAFPRDVWINRVLKNEYPGGYPFERYSPYNGVYQQYMFDYYRRDTGNREQGTGNRE